MHLKKWLGWLVIVLALYFIVSAPDTAAGAAQGFGETLREFADSAVTFLQGLSS